MRIALVLLISLMTTTTWGKRAEKGILPELQIKSTDTEDDNQKKAVQTEVLIAKTEAAAMASLQKIIVKKKGSPEEPDLWFRLAELFMRRAKAGRFFDLNREGNNKVLSIAPPVIREESAAKNLKKAVEIFAKIEKDFPKYYAMDAVYFNHAFARQQLKDDRLAQEYYLKLIERFPKSVLIADTHLAVGEMNYNQQRYNMALEHFLAIEQWPGAKVYTYAIYKAAWTYYNLQQTEKGMEKLAFVANYFHPDGENAKTVKPQYNLRPEALRDLAIFFSDKRSSEEAFPFFVKVCTDSELGESLLTLSSIYDAHSKYKDVNIVLNELIKKRPDNSARVKAYLSLVNANESMKARKDVITHLQAASDICDKKTSDSRKWREKNPKQAAENCDIDFPKLTLEIAKKWWEIWLKNRQHKEFADLTQEAFRIYLDRDDPKSPDSKSRFAYGELLFQRERYREASKQYEMVSNATADHGLLHDSSYGAMVALEKASIQKKDSKDNDEMLRLALAYLEKNPKGKYLDQVNFKVGFIYYETKKLELAEKQLKPLANDTKAGEFKKKAEDILLDILNQRKDYEGIKALTAQLIGTNKDTERKAYLTKLLEEADYASILVYNKKAKPFEAAEKLKKFYDDHPQSPLAKDSLWQALSLGFSSGRTVDAADMAKEYRRRYADDKRSLDALKEAARAYGEAGMLDVSAATLMEIAQVVDGKEKSELLETAAEFYLLEGQAKQARGLFEKLSTEKSSKEQGPILYKILMTLKGNESSAEYMKIENRLLQIGFEPFSSEIQVKRLQALYDQKKYTEAFNTAKNIVGGNGSEDSKAQARMIQALVLEQELAGQSMKTNLDRLPAVLGLKTEKLDKAQTAFLNAAKLAKSPHIQIQALEGLNRCYKNYVDSINAGIVKGELQPDEKKALEEELGKITSPFKEKVEDTNKKLQSLYKEFQNVGRAPAKQQAKAPAVPDFYLPELNTDSDLKSFARAQALSPICTNKDMNTEASILKVQQRINFCILANKMDIAAKWMDRLARLAPKSPLTTFYWSVLAEKRGLLDKALYLTDQSLRLNDGLSFVHYQRGRLLLASQKDNQAMDSFKKAKDLKLKTTDLENMFAADQKSGGGA